MASILVADDEPQIGNFLRMFLEAEGYRVRLACDGQAALELALEERPDLVLTDWAMPRLNGDGLCNALRRVPATQDVPVIMMSAVTYSAAQGCAAFIPKPFDVNDLLQLIRQCLAGGGPTGSAEQVAHR